MNSIKLLRTAQVFCVFLFGLSDFVILIMAKYHIFAQKHETLCSYKIIFQDQILMFNEVEEKHFFLLATCVLK